MRDGRATRRRALDAAAAEFAAHGIAGARVDRIAAAASVNKAQMYGFFGSKDGLFDAVFAEHVTAIVDAVPVDGADLPGYAVGLYDEYLARPEVVRLATWARLERRPTGDLYAGIVRHDDDKLMSIAAAQTAGLVEPTLEPAEVQQLVIAVSLTWGPASIQEAAHRGESEAVHERRRRVLAEVVRRMFAPGGSG